MSLPRRCGCDFGPGTGFGLLLQRRLKLAMPGRPSDGPDGGEGDRGTSEGSKPRQILITKDQWVQMQSGETPRPREAAPVEEEI
ncbi:MAG: hypothetical protein ACLS43_01525 [Evtepia gabavorous]